MTRVATFVQHSVNVSHTLRTQERIADAQIQVSTGQKAQRYSGIAGEARRLVSLEATALVTQQYARNNSLVDLRLQTMESTVSTVLDRANALRTNLISALNGGSGDATGLATNAEHLIQELGSLLNVRVDGRYLFAGTRTDARPVDFSDPGFGSPGSIYPSSANTEYYQGDDTLLSVRADEALDIRYGMTAADPAFEKVVRAMHLAASSSAAGGLLEDRANDALRVVNEAIDLLPGMIGRIGAASASLTAINAKHDEFLLYAQLTIGDIEGADVTETITRLSNDAAALQASYATLARVGGLSLLNYLR